VRCREVRIDRERAPVEVDRRLEIVALEDDALVVERRGELGVGLQRRVVLLDRERVVAGVLGQQAEVDWA
jgi:hypothetical protein